MRAAEDRVVETRRGRRRAVDDGDLVARLEDGREERTHLVGRLGLGAVGGEAVVEGDGGEVGDDVAGHAAGHHHRLEGLAVLAPLDDGPALLEAVDEAQELAQAVDGVAAHPRPRRVGPLPAQADLHPQRALAPGLQLAAGGLAEDRHVAGEQVGPVAQQVGQAVVLGGDLLARVEDVGDVDRGIGDRLRAAPASRPGRPSCPALPRPHSTSPSMRGSALPFTGTVSVWPARITRSNGPRWVRATRLAPTRSTVEVRQAAAAGPRGDRRAALRRGSPTGSPPAAPSRRGGRVRELGHGAHARYGGPP